MSSFSLKFNPKLTVLSFGGGQDSTTILYKLMLNPDFRKEYAPRDLVVVMAETGNEHDETYTHLVRVKHLCKVANIPFFHIGMDEYTAPSWRKGLIGFYQEGNRIGSKAYPKSCTDQLKIRPIYKWLDEYVYNTYDIDAKPGRKAAIKEFTKHYGRIQVLLGIAKGEEKRASINEESPNKWMRDCIHKRYPLIELGMDRQACQDYFVEIDADIPMPSNCILCPFLSHQELLYMYRMEPDWYNFWVKLEQNKIDANKHMGDNNMGVWGRKLLPEVLKEAEEKYGHMTNEELRKYKMSHGHCVMSKY